MKTKVILVDDHQLFNDGLKSLLSTEKNIEVIGQVFEAKNLLFYIQKLRPDLIFLDINLPDGNGLELATTILRDFSDLKIVLLTMYNEPQMLQEAKRIKVHGYVLKNASKEILLESIREIMSGKTFFDDKIKKTTEIRQNDNFTKANALTEREIEVLKNVKQGLDSYQIAEQMCLSYLTIKTHRRNIHFKIGTKTTPEMIRFAHENGF